MRRVIICKNGVMPAFLTAIAMFSACFPGYAAENTTANNAGNSVVAAENKSADTVDKPGISSEGVIIGKDIKHTIAENDTLPVLARKYGVGFVELQAANPDVDAWLPKPGTVITVPNRYILPKAAPDGLVVNVGEMRIYYFEKSGKAPITYPIGIGREGLNTPAMVTTITRKAEGPVWHPTPRMRQLDPSLPELVGPGPDNPLGTHALYIGTTDYRIHGTNKPLGIGRRASSGCLRMYPENIIPLYKKVPVGTKVTIVNEPIKKAWYKDRLYLEAQPSAKQADEIEFSGKATTFEWPEGIISEIRKEAAERNKNVDWSSVRRIITERRGIAVPITD